MQILVLDTIHGGRILGDAFLQMGHDVDCVDVYRGGTGAAPARAGGYDLVVAPVHLDPDHPLLSRASGRVISHHEAAGVLLGGTLPSPMIEITGARGKTTTAHALASLMPGAGILHSSRGTFRLPGMHRVSRSSITPASVIGAATLARSIDGWLIAEESLGVTGAGSLSVITSGEDYRIAAGKKSALAAKVGSVRHARRLLLADGVEVETDGQVTRIGDIAAVNGGVCSIRYSGTSYRFENPLLSVFGYRQSLALAAAAAVLLGIDPTPLSAFREIPGRMAVSHEGDLLVVDNSNSGLNPETMVQAAEYARTLSGTVAVTLVTGQVTGDGAVCEGLSAAPLLEAIERIGPEQIIWVGALTPEFKPLAPRISAYRATLEEGRTAAVKAGGAGSVVLAVKTWR